MADNLSLESILAEIKGSAFIEGDVKTPSHILEAEAERILREASMGSEPSVGRADLGTPQFAEPTPKPAQSAPPAPPASEFAPVGGDAHIAPPHAPEFAPSDSHPASEFAPVGRADPGTPQPTSQFAQPAPPPPPPPEPETPEAAAERLINEAYERYDEPEVFRNPAEPDFGDTSEIPMIVAPREDAPQSGSSRRGGQSRQSTPMFAEDLPSVDIPLDDHYTVAKSDYSATEGSYKGTQASYGGDVERNAFFDQATLPEDEEFGREVEPDEEYVYEEPRLKDQAVKFARKCNFTSLRLLPAAIISIIMVLITYVHEAGMLVPFGIGHSLEYAAGTLIMLQLIVMMLCYPIINRGVSHLMVGNLGAEVLVLFSCVFSLISATFTILSGAALVLPFCAVSALSIVCAAFGERSQLRAMTDSIKTAISTAESYGVQAEYHENMDKSVLKKAYCRTDGYYTNLVQQDIGEVLYGYATPVLLASVLFMTIINVLVNKNIEKSLHVLSALLASAASFSALLSFSLPFNIVTQTLRKLGVALAGWGGADDIAYTDGVCVTDDDLFPQGTLALTAVKIFDGAAPNNVLCYTASLIIASGSGLANLFAAAIKEQGITPLRTANFECHESGISALIQGHKVATGSAAHMNLIGIRVPDDSNMRNALFTAVNGRLVAMFTIDYKPLPGVQNALISMIKWRIDLFFAMRDFNITPSMVGQKFKVPFESFVFMPVQDSYAISDPYSGKQGRMAAVLVRESLGPYAHAITGARLLRSASLLATILSVASAGLGVFLMFIMLWDGSFLSATPGNLILYMLSMLVAVLIVCGYVKIRK